MTPEKLPSELEETILVRVPQLSLARFRTVCKRWNILLNDMRFMNNHLALAGVSPHFILRTNSKVYSVSVSFDDDPMINVCEISLEIPGLDCNADAKFFHCDGLLLCTNWNNGGTVWNPWLRQSRWIECNANQSGLCGIGYDSSGPEKSYKIIGYTYFRENNYSEINGNITIYECTANTCKYIDAHYKGNFISKQSLLDNVSLNGNLYWVSYDSNTAEHFIQCLDCSKEILKPLCVLPCEKKSSCLSHALAVFKENRFSLLEQCNTTGNIEIWITENTIKSSDDGEVVLWSIFTSVSMPNFPILYNRRNAGFPSSYLIDDGIYGKSFAVCCRDEDREACIFVVRGDMCKKIKLNLVVGQFSHSVYAPSVITIPSMSSDQDNTKNLTKKKITPRIQTYNFIILWISCFDC